MQDHRCSGRRFATSDSKAVAVGLTSCSGIEVVRKAIQDVEEISFAPLTGQADEATVSYGVVTTPKITFLSTVVGVTKISKDESRFLSQFTYEISKHRCFQRELDGLNTQVAF